jgi:predicted phosphodiesterase
MPNLIDKVRSHITEGVGIKVYNDANELPVIESHSTSQITNEKQLLEAGGFSLDEWEVEASTANVWHQFSGDNGLVPLWQVKARLRRKDLSQSTVAQIIHDGFVAFRNAVKLPLSPLAKPSKKGKGTMVEFALPDLHLGKFAWNEETGHGNWDLRIAENVYKEAIEDLLSRSPEAEEAWLIVGNDFFNVDNDSGTTTAGTPQDEDGRWQKTFKKGKELLLWAIGRLRKKYPNVKVIVVYGNHDKQRTYYVGEVLAEAAKSMTGVEVDNRPLDRKFYKWGDTGLGYTHGDRIKVKDLAHLVQNEARVIWGTTKRFELHLGHLHQDIVKSLGGVTVRWIPALCPPDAWHAKSGYTMAERAAMLFEYDQHGMKNLYVHYPRPELFE